MNNRGRRYSVEEKKLLVHEWKGSGLRQEVYAGQLGISPRTLRSWIQAYSPGTPPMDRVLKVIATAQAELERIRLAIETAAPEPVPVDMPAGSVSSGLTAEAGEVGSTARRPRFSWD